MQSLLKGAVLAVCLILAGEVLATDRPDHFKGLAAPDLQTALDNFTKYNKHLEKAINGELTHADLANIHQLTYTLENALKKINTDLAALEEALEEVHLTSETLKRDELKKAGEAYFKTVKILDF